MSITLIVEDGTLVTGANTFVSLTDCDTYHEEEGNTSWSSATTDNRLVAIVKAARYLDRHYKGRWKGTKVDQYQYMPWPRGGVYDADGFAISITCIPPAVKFAQCEAALRLLSSSMDPDLERGGEIVKEEIDVLSIEYSPDAPAGTVYQVIDSLLSDLIKSNYFHKVVVA
jgi:hypothetical protein